MDAYKEVIFAPRIKTFNETFAQVGGGKVLAIVWDETQSGRKSEDILCAFDKVFRKHKDCERIILWMDNCSGQNKNWQLFVHVCLIVNSHSYSIKNIEFKYFESGHTFMAADSYHHMVEQAMKSFKKGNIVTFEDFVHCAKNAQNKTEATEVIPLKFTDFFTPSLTVTQYTLNKMSPRPKIDNMRHLKFTKGELSMRYCDRGKFIYRFYK